MSNITIKGIPHDTFTFPGGEIQVKLDTSNWFLHTSTTILARVHTSRDLVELGLVCNALNEMNITFDITLPYLPYARQDRVCEDGEAHGVRFIVEYLVKMCEPETITCYDLHSDVALLHGSVRQVEQSEILCQYSYQFKDYDTLISPDAGSLKKIYKAATALGIFDVVKADKVRNTITGEIKSTEVYVDTLKGKSCLIVDDICDGGRTFIELAKVLKAKGAEKVGLYVTHGIFSKGLAVLRDSGIDEVYTTDTWHPWTEEAYMVEEGLYYKVLPVIKDNEE